MGIVIAVSCWILGLPPLGIAVLTLLCDVDGQCDQADTDRRILGLTMTAMIWLASGPLAWIVGRRKWLFAASIVPFVGASPLALYFLAGP